MPIETLPSFMDGLRTTDKLGGTWDAYCRVPTLYRSVNLRADAISSVPYRIERRNRTVDWMFATTLPELMRNTEISLLLTGAAFWLRIMKGNVLIGFQVLNPYTVQVDIDQKNINPLNPVQSMTFTQTINGQKAGKWTAEEIIYFREMSFSDEVRHGLPPVAVALQSSQLQYYQERFTSAFFEHGAQPVTIMSMPTDTSKEEMERFSKDWISKFVGGSVRAFRTAFVRGGDIKPTVVTPPIKDMMLPELQERAERNICKTLGVPITMLEASAANYATAQSDVMSFWRTTIIPRLGMYEQVINNQLLIPLGYKLVYTPEAMDVMQTDEAQRASALLALTQAGVAVDYAMEILGYDTDFINRMRESAQPQVTEAPTPQLPPPTNPDAPTPQVEETAEDAVDVANEQTTKAFVLWRRKAERRLINQKSLAFDFTHDDINTEDNAWIKYQLADCTSIQEIKSLFDSLKAMDLTPQEEALYDVIRTYLGARGEEAVLILQSGQALPDGFLDGLMEELRPILTAKMRDDLNKLEDRYTIDIDPAVEEDIIVRQFQAYAPKLIKELNATTEKLVKRVIDNARQVGGITNEELAIQLTPAFGDRRASMIAVTEYTRSASNATSVYQEYLSEYGIKTVRVWNTEADEIVKQCPICYPLNGKTEDVWGERYPSGAPAHPRCRCDVTLKVVRQ
jgi:HK97 family phage portal protein